MRIFLLNNTFLEAKAVSFGFKGAICYLHGDNGVIKEIESKEILSIQTIL